MSKVFPIAVAALVSSGLCAFAGGGSHGSGGGLSGSGGGHHASSGAVAPAGVPGVSPRISGMPHYSGQLPASYRPTISYRNGTKTLNYPAVHGSNVHHSLNSNLRSVNSSARVIKHNGSGVHHNSADLARSGNLQGRPGNRQHAGAVNLNAKNRLDPQASARLRHWNGKVSSNAEAQQNHWDNCHHHHNHDWWHNHCVAFIFWDWGWWGWWDGWWYPAWGYDPYSYYGYNEPIYGYGDLSPEQIVAGVQSALQERGYYSYAVDGQMGPLTRSAIARYQRDHRLPITYGIDPATLGSLGIVH